MEFTSATGRQRYEAIVARADELVVGLDFDGVLSPIVEDPTQA
jgi:trehalose 6-phosphate phosphatase